MSGYPPPFPLPGVPIPDWEAGNWGSRQQVQGTLGGESWTRVISIRLPVPMGVALCCLADPLAPLMRYRIIYGTGGVTRTSAIFPAGTFIAGGLFIGVEANLANGVGLTGEAAAFAWLCDAAPTVP